MLRNILVMPMALVSAALFLLIGAMPLKGVGENPSYFDYESMEEGATAKLRAYMKSNPGVTLDSLRRCVIDGIAEGPVGKSAELTDARKKKLTPEKLYEVARKSSLIFGRMENNPAFGRDSAYKTASAVALTPDGICGTNYHVVADIVLGGALGKMNADDMIRFVMDCDGNVYPLTGILAVDPLNDWAIIKVDPCGRKLTPAPIGGDMVPGSTVYCLASPSNAYFHFTDGIVANCTRSTNKRTGFTKYILEITADYGVGASGGPVFDECGNLVALVSSTVSLYAQPQQFRNFQMAYKQTVPVFLLKQCFTD